MWPRKHNNFLTLLFSLSCWVLAFSAQASEPPNIVLIVVDDAGLMDFSSYGGEAQTPHIDALGASGVRFTHYHTSPLCATSRAMLLTGLDSHRTGIGTIPEVLTPDQHGQHSYAMRLNPGVLTLADHLRGAGYATFMTGKWHLGRAEGDLPNHHGFDRSFVLDASGADNWEQKSYLPYYDIAPWFEDGAPATLPEDFYSSEFLVDKMMSYLATRDPSQPFFAYIGFQAIHIPVQAPREYTQRYEGVYDQGWHVLQQRRLRRARELGLMPETAPAPDTLSLLQSWQDLLPEQRQDYTRRMMVNAGMLEAMDHHIGRLLSFLKERAEFDNTIFVVTSDNGPEYNDPTKVSTYRLWMSLNDYHDDLEGMGERGSVVAIGPEWAGAASTPGRLFKMSAAQGGLRVPLIMTGPGIQSLNFVAGRSYVHDVTPTLMELAGVSIPQTLDGRSLAPILSGAVEQVYQPDEAVGIEVSGNAALFKGGYKLTRNILPYGDGEWRLHDIEEDPAEQNDLSAEKPALKSEMLADYEHYAARVGVIDVPDDFNLAAQVTKNTGRALIERYSVALFLSAAFILLLSIVVFVRRR